MTNNNTFFIKTWGCQMNIYDSLKIEQRMLYKHYIKVTNPLFANILILNTCSIRKKAQDKLFDQLGRWAKLKQYNKDLIITVGGCGAIQDAQLILTRMPYINIIFSPKTLHKLPYLINVYKQYRKPIIYINYANNLFLKKFIHFPTFFSNTPYSAFVTIMEGCNKFCSYCVVPYTRGKEISRPVHSILAEINFYLSKGVKEIILLGQNVNAYQGLLTNNQICSFSKLLILISKFDELKRIRFISSHPIEFTNDLILQYKNNPKIVSLLHLPIQSGSNKILKIMNRKYTVEKYLWLVNELKKMRPNLNISSDFIVGFPEETEQDILQTLNIIKLVKFDKSYSFIYSPRPHTPASKLINNLSNIEKKKRLLIIQTALSKCNNQITKQMINTIQPVLITNYLLTDSKFIIGITDNNRKIVIKGHKSLLGKLMMVKIIYIKNNHFIGKLI